MTSTAHSLDRYHNATINVFGANPTLANLNITISQLSYGEEGVFYPAQDVTIYGPALKTLRNILNKLPAE